MFQKVNVGSYGLHTTVICIVQYSLYRLPPIHTYLERLRLNMYSRWVTLPCVISRTLSERSHSDCSPSKANASWALLLATAPTPNAAATSWITRFSRAVYGLYFPLAVHYLNLSRWINFVCPLGCVGTIPALTYQNGLKLFVFCLVGRFAFVTALLAVLSMCHHAFTSRWLSATIQLDVDSSWGWLALVSLSSLFAWSYARTSRCTKA